MSNKTKPDKVMEDKQTDLRIKNFKQEKRKSNVRIVTTYAAGAYIFIGSIILMLYITFCTKKNNLNNFQEVKDIFMLVLPVATGIITYWFSARSNQRNGSIPNTNNKSEKRVPSHDPPTQDNNTNTNNA